MEPTSEHARDTMVRVRVPWMFSRSSRERRKRYREIASALARHGLGVISTRTGLGWLVPFHRGWLGHVRRDLPYSTAEHVRLALEEIGTTGIKLGQVLSTRPDLVPPELEEELEKLRDRVQPVLTDAILGAIERELGRPADKVFDTFEDDPLAAASIGQVHGATLRDGPRVVVKVRKPGIAETVETDLEILANLARRAAERDPEADYDVVGLADEFGRTLRSELDYVREGRNADRLRAILAEDPRVAVPEIHWPLTRSGVLVMQRMEGTRIGDFEVLDARGLDRAAIARTSADALMRQVFHAGFFHADPHPGNFLVDEGGRIAVLDFGMVGRLDDDTRRSLVELLLATVRQDPDAMMLAFQTLGILGPRGAPGSLRGDLRRFLDDYYGLSVDQFDLGSYLRDLLSVVRQNRLVLPSELALVLKTVGMSEGLWRQLDPTFNAASAAERYAHEVAAELSSPALLARRAVENALRLIAAPHVRALQVPVGSERDANPADPEALPSQIRAATSRVIAAVVAAGTIVALAILTTAYRPPGWSLLAPLLFVGGSALVLVIALRLLVLGRRRRH